MISYKKLLPFVYALKQKATLVLVAGAYIILSLKLLRFIYSFSENVLFWDQWDIFEQVLKENNVLKLFFYQHNEHRMGVSLIITKILAQLTGWNVRFETVVIGLIIILSSIMALVIKQKITRKLEIYDIFIPFLFLNLYQYENLIWGFQIGFTLPLLFLMTAVLLFASKGSTKTYACLLLLSFVSAYTHFHGLFVSLLVALYFFIKFQSTSDKKSKERHRYFLYFVINVLIIISYFVGYHLSRFLGAENFNLIEFFQYIFFQINSLAGNYNKHLLGYILIPCIAFFAFVSLLLSLRAKNITYAYSLLSLFLFSFLFSISTAYGRIGAGGINGAYTSRYVTFMIPLYLGIYIYLTKFLNTNIKNSLMTFAIVFFVFASSQNNHFNYTYALNRKNGLRDWKICYEKFENSKYCQAAVNIEIYPSPDTTSLDWKLQFLKNNNLSFFRK